jgi:hypothetical protein
MLRQNISTTIVNLFSYLLITLFFASLQGCNTTKHSENHIQPEKVAVVLPYKPADNDKANSAKLQKILEGAREIVAPNLIFTFHGMSSETDIDKVINMLKTEDYKAVIGPYDSEMASKLSAQISKFDMDILHLPLDFSGSSSSYKSNNLRPVNYNSSGVNALMKCLTNDGYDNIITLLPKTHESLNTRGEISRAAERYGGNIIAEEFYLTTSNKYASHMEDSVKNVAVKVNEIMEDDTNWFKPVIFVNEADNKQQFYKALSEYALFSNAKVIGLSQINPPYKQDYTHNSKEFTIYFPGSEKLVASKEIKRLNNTFPDTNFAPEELLALDYASLLNDNLIDLSRGSKNFLTKLNNTTWEGFTGKLKIKSNEIHYSHIVIKRNNDKLEKFCPYF